MNDLLKNVLLWVVIAVILVAVFNNLGGQAQIGNEITYSEFIQQVKSGKIQTAHHTWKGTLFPRSKFKDIIYLHQSPYLFDGTVYQNVAYGIRFNKPGYLPGKQHISLFFRRGFPLGCDL